MITVPAHKVKQFGVEFYQASFSAADIDRLVRFEVLGYASAEEPPGKKRRRPSRINWELLEKRIAQGEAALPRPPIGRKIEELLKYSGECQEAENLPAIPGAVIIIAERRLQFAPGGAGRSVGVLQIPEEPGILRALDGQHRLLALHAAADELKGMEVPAVVFDNLDDRQVVELFVPINAKHTRLNPSHLISLAGRRLYTNENQALAHDVIRALNETESSPLAGEIRILGVGRGKVSQAPLAEEMVELLETVRKIGGEGRGQGGGGGGRPVGCPHRRRPLRDRRGRAAEAGRGDARHGRDPRPRAQGCPPQPLTAGPPTRGDSPSHRRSWRPSGRGRFIGFRPSEGGPHGMAVVSYCTPGSPF